MRAGSPLTGKEQLLVVEDNDEDFEALSRILRKLGIENPIRRCGDGDECLDLLAGIDQDETQAGKNLPGLILLDLNMPGTDGRTVLKKIKSDLRLKAIPVTVLTTSANVRDVEACYEYGANAYVLKPIDYDDLMEAVRTITDFWLRAAVLPPVPTVPANRRPDR